MKAVWLLFCLGLARGSIFRRHYLPQMERFTQRLESVETNPQDNPQLVRHTIVYDPTLAASNNQQNLEESRRVNADYYPTNNQRYNKKHMNKKLSKSLQDSNENLERFRYADGEYYQIPQYADQERVFSINKRISRPNQAAMPNDEDLEQFRLVKGVYYSIPRYGDEQQSLIKKNTERTEAYGNAAEWRGIKYAIGPQSKILKKDIENIFYEAQNSMKHPSEETKEKYHEMYEAVSEEKTEDAILNATQLLNKYQYPVEEHVVKTDDGYFLTLFRIVKQTERKTDDVVQRPVVLLMHSMLGSADDWLLMGPTHSLAYLLADQGYDVWLGNARGNKYSRYHVNHHPAQDDFWHYSNDDIALLDLPAMIDYALKTTGQRKLFYVGYDLGTTAFFALASTRPEYNDKVAMMYALSPMAYMDHVRSPLVKMIAPNSPFYNNLKPFLKDGEFKPSKELVYTMGGEMLENEIGCKKIASNVNFVMSGMNVDNMDVSTIRVIMGHVPAGGSTRQVRQYGQAAATREFRMYDYGSATNQEVYGEQVPPVYDVTRIRVPVALYSSEHDWLAHPKDVLRLKEQLPNVTEYYQVPEEYFSHMDFLYSLKAPVVIYKKLIDSINNNIHKN